MDIDRVRSYVFGAVYPMYVAKIEKKHRSQAELIQVICWLTGYTEHQLFEQIEHGKTFGEFFEEAPSLHPNRQFITGTICGIKVETIDDDFMRNVRYLDKLVDELAKGRPMAKILRQAE